MKFLVQIEQGKNLSISQGQEPSNNASRKSMQESPYSLTTETETATLVKPRCESEGFWRAHWTLYRQELLNTLPLRRGCPSCTSFGKTALYTSSGNPVLHNAISPEASTDAWNTREKCRQWLLPPSTGNSPLGISPGFSQLSCTNNLCFWRVTIRM